MDIEQTLVKTFRQLPAIQQQKVLLFTQSLIAPSEQLAEENDPIQKANEWLKFMQNQPQDTHGLPDEAIGRETIYD
ncbi:MAG: hypothetical protein ACKO5Q_00360 [Microcystaceae cyanobacterium]